MAEISATQWQELNPLLDELLDVQSDARAARLAQIRRDDAALAERLEMLLRQRTAMDRDSFMEGSAFAMAEEPSLVGQTIGAYTLREAIGQGGMGSVWRAERSDGRYEATVAVKFLNLALLGRGGVERFAREGSMLARLTHPNIARLLDAGVAAGAAARGQPYLVLEYIDGMPIDAWCDARSLGIEARLRLFLDVVAAVAHAHSNLILHRDLKPSNILITPGGDVKLLDFGIGKLIEDQTGAASPTELTQLAGRAFTPDFAAPEQITQGDVTTATDVYALGVLLYLLLTGRHPTAQAAATQVDRLRAVVEVDAVRPSDATTRVTPSDVAALATARATTPHKLTRALRGDLDNILAKALKKSPAERYQTVAAFAGDLQRHLAHEPVTARPDALGYRVSKFVRRYRVGVGVVALTLLILIGGIVGTAWQAQEARRAQTLAEASAAEARTQREAAQFEARLARANHEFVSQLFGDAMRAGESDQMRAQLDRARELLRRRYADDPVVHSLLLFQLAGRYAELGERKREDEILQEIEMLSKRANDPSLSAVVECVKAYELIRGGKSDAAKPHVDEGLRLMSKMARPLTPVGFECYRADAMLAAATGEHARGVARMERWLEELERDGLEKTRAYVNSLASLAYIHGMAGQLVPSLTVARRARALNEALGSEATLSSQTELDREAHLLFQLGRMSEAIEVDREMFRRFEIIESGGTPPPLFVYKAAWHSIIGGNAEDGVAWLRNVLPRLEREGPEVNARGVILDLASGFAVQQREADARSMLRRYEARLVNGPPRPRELVEAGRIAVEIAMAAGDTTEMISALDRLEAALRADKLPHPNMLQGLLTAGFARLKQGNIERAREHASRATTLAAAKVIDGQDSAWVGASELLLARIALAEHDRTAARDHLALAGKHFSDTLHSDHHWRRDVEALSAKL
jgi:serine/threonine protein kinase